MPIVVRIAASSASHVTTSDVENTTVRKIFSRLLPFVFLLYVVNYLDRINVGFAALQMQAQLGLSDRVYGLGAGIFFVGYLGLQLPSNLALVRVGARRWIAAIVGLWGVISSCMIFVHSAHSFYALRFLLGATEAGFFPGIILYLKGWLPPSGRARGMALFLTGLPIAGVLGGPISGALLQLHAGPLAGWQWLFLLEGVPAVLLGFATLWILPDRPNAVSWVSREECRWLLAALKSESDIHPDKGQHWSAVFFHARVWLLTISYFGLTTCMYGLVYFLPKMIRSVSAATNFSIGLLSAIPYFVAAVVMVAAATHSDRSGERRWHMAVLALLGAAGAWGAGYAGSSFAIVVLLSAALSGCFGILAPFWALSSSVLSESTLAAGIAVINSLGNLGGFFGPYAVGLLRNVSAGFRGGMSVIAAALLVTGVFGLLVRIETGRSQDISSNFR